MPGRYFTTAVPRERLNVGLPRRRVFRRARRGKRPACRRRGRAAPGRSQDDGGPGRAVMLLAALLLALAAPLQVGPGILLSCRGRSPREPGSSAARVVAAEPARRFAGRSSPSRDPTASAGSPRPSIPMPRAATKCGTPAGAYLVTARPNQYQAQYPPPRAGHALAGRSSAHPARRRTDPRGLRFVLPRAGAILLRLVDENGDPVSGVAGGALRPATALTSGNSA